MMKINGSENSYKKSMQASPLFKKKKKENLPYIEPWCISSLKTLVTLYKAGYKSGTKECQGIDTRQYIRFT